MYFTTKIYSITIKMGVVNTLFHNKIIHIYLCECLTYSLPRWFIWPALHSQRLLFQKFYNLYHTFVASFGKRQEVDKCSDLASTSRIVYHPPPALSMQGRKQVGLDHMNLFDGSLATSLQRKRVNKHRKYWAYTDQLYSTFPSGQLAQRTQCTTFIYHWKKLYYLSTWPCRMLLN